MLMGETPGVRNRVTVSGPEDEMEVLDPEEAGPPTAAQLFPSGLLDGASAAGWEGSRPAATLGRGAGQGPHCGDRLRQHGQEG